MKIYRLIIFDKHNFIIFPGDIKLSKDLIKRKRKV
jgi:hypothetical protein